MTKKAVFASILLFGIMVFFTGHGNASGSVVMDRVVAVVNDEIITLSDLQREEAQNKKNELKKDERLTLEDMIDKKLQMAAAKRGGMEVTDKDLADAIEEIKKKNNMDGKEFETAIAKEGLTLEQYKIELREQMTLSRVFNKYVRTNVTMDEAEAKTFYDDHRKNYVLPEEIRMRQIFLPANGKNSAAVKEQAERIYARAKKGDDFIELVHEVSKGVTASQDGDLGFIQREQVIPAISAAIKSLKPGEISAPFLNGGGYNIILVEEIRTPTKPFEKVKDEIMNTLYQQKMENTYRTWLQSLRGDSHIENRL